MKIRAGYEISYDCPQPTPMILTRLFAGDLPTKRRAAEFPVHPPAATGAIGWHNFYLEIDLG
jgi:hypothetical protein